MPPASAAEWRLKWVDCDVDSQYVMGFTQREDDRIVAIIHNFGTDIESTRFEAVSLTKSSTENIDKSIIVYGTMNLRYDVKKKIIQFNKTNDAYRVEVREYSNDQAGQDRLSADIVSGNGPDIVDLSCIDADSFIDQGILADLNTFIDEDSTFSRDDFVENVFEVYENNGQLYGIPLSFTIDTMLAKTSVVGEEMGWNIEDLQNIMETYPDGAEIVEFYGKTDILEKLLTAGVEAYVDWGNGTCSFDSEEFIRLLELVNSFPDYASSTESDDSTYLKLKENRLLLVELHMQRVGDYLMNAAIFEEPVTAIGYPSTEGSGTLIRANGSIGILEQSENKEGACNLLGEDFQDSIEAAFPVRESSLQKVFELVQQEDLNFSVGIEMAGGFTYTQQAATDEEIAQIRKIIDNAQGTTSSNAVLNNIIAEEVSPYFNGQKSVEDVVSIIQSRAEIYVSENS